mgnify:CR=1 FL=1
MFLEFHNFPNFPLSINEWKQSRIQVLKRVVKQSDENDYSLLYLAFLRFE